VFLPQSSSSGPQYSHLLGFEHIEHILHPCTPCSKENRPGGGSAAARVGSHQTSQQQKQSAAGSQPVVEHSGRPKQQPGRSTQMFLDLGQVRVCPCCTGPGSTLVCVWPNGLQHTATSLHRHSQRLHACGVVGTPVAACSSDHPGSGATAVCMTSTPPPLLMPAA
jgi:hypothetical protein